MSLKRKPVTVYCQSLLWLGFLLLLMPVQGFAEDVGRVIVSMGKIVASNQGQADRILKRRSVIMQGDVINTGTKGRVQIRMKDGAMLALQEQSVFRIDKYHYKGKEDGSENAAFKLLKGGMRTITGVIGRKNKENYSLQTPVGTIGIRGTHFAVQIKDNALFGGVVDGAVVFSNSTGEHVFGNDQYFRVDNTDSAPKQLLAPPEFLFGESNASADVEEEESDSGSGEKDDSNTNEDDSSANEKDDSGSSSTTDGGDSDTGSQEAIETAGSEVSSTVDSSTADGSIEEAATGALKLDGSELADTSGEVLVGSLSETSTAVDAPVYQAAETTTSSGTLAIVSELKPVGIGTIAPVNAVMLGADIVVDPNGSLNAGVFDMLNNADNAQIWLDHSGTLPGSGGAGNIPVYLYYFDLNPDANDPKPCSPCSFSHGSGTLTGIAGDGLGVNWGRWQGGYIAGGSSAGTEKGFNWIYSPNVTPFSALPTTGSAIVFNLVGGTAVDDNGSNLTIDGGSMTVDFIDKQIDAFSVSSSGNFALNSTGAVGFGQKRIPIADGSLQGEATFEFVGSAAQGVMSSFGANDGTDAVSGVVFLKQ